MGFCMRDALEHQFSGRLPSRLVENCLLTLTLLCVDCQKRGVIDRTPECSTRVLPSAFLLTINKLKQNTAFPALRLRLIRFVCTRVYLHVCMLVCKLYFLTVLYCTYICNATFTCPRRDLCEAARSASHNSLLQELHDRSVLLTVTRCKSMRKRHCSS